MTLKHKPARVILDPLPTLYVYDHCPFCVRVRLAFGLKNIKHEIRFLANDDIPTPTKLIGKKIAPIFEYKSNDPSKSFVMPESLDIVKKIDSLIEFGPINYFKPFSGRKDLSEWQASVADNNRILQRPRYMLSFLPEFQQQDSKDAFVYNHPLPPYSKDEWIALSYQERWDKYHSAFEVSKSLTWEVSKSLEDLDKLVYSQEYVSEGGLSLDDIDLWARLRSVTLCKGIVWPTKLRSYMDNLSKLSDVPLYDGIAI
eukprot:gene20165-26179_t